MIKLQVIGRVGKDATVKEVGGTKVINFSLAHSEKYKDSKGEMQEKTTWVECAKWGEKIGVAEYIKKGGQIFVEGTPEVRSYDKADGGHGVSLIVRVDKIELLSSATGASQVSEKAKEKVTDGAPVPAEGDLPF